jgi:DNA-binding response OmpR family regulator
VETILVIDDSQIYLDQLKISLESYGYRILTAGSGNEGWLKLEAERVDLVILDAAMPGEDGHSFARRVRDDARLSPVPLIFLTGFTSAADRAKAFECGGDDFLAKPCSVGELVPRIRYHLKRRAWQRRLDEGLARIQDVERSRDELLALLVHDVRGIVNATEAVLRRALEPGRLSGPGLEEVRRALRYIRDAEEIVQGVHAHHQWRPLRTAVAEPKPAEPAATPESPK